jgi:DNA-binding CsgD family transcriptional regulator
MLASYRGNERTTQEITAEMMRWATPRRVRAVHEFWNLALHSAALGNGDYETAYQCAIAITAPGELPPYVSIAVFTLFGLVEAAVRTGRQVEAEAHVRAMEEANLQAISSRLALVVAGAQGLVASDEDATSLFQKAVNLPGVDQWPFDLARVELAFGEHLRRNRVITQARTHLNAALNIFVALGAKPWSTRAATELRATGVSNRPIDLGRGEALTAQELQVASLAAAGFSNKEIGQKLNMSPRTVGTHLYRTFPKLGITSRAALRDALAALATQVAPPEVVRI